MMTGMQGEDRITQMGGIERCRPEFWRWQFGKRTKNVRGLFRSCGNEDR